MADELEELNAANVRDLNDYIAKEQEHRALTDRFFPVTTNPGPGNPIRSGEPLTPESMALLERSSKELEEALERHTASMRAYVEAYQRSQRPKG